MACILQCISVCANTERMFLTTYDCNSRIKKKKLFSRCIPSGCPTLQLHIWDRAMDLTCPTVIHKPHRQSNFNLSSTSWTSIIRTLWTLRKHMHPSKPNLGASLVKSLLNSLPSRSVQGLPNTPLKYQSAFGCLRGRPLPPGRLCCPGNGLRL